MPPLRVLHLDDQLIAVDKPAGRIVIPGRGAPERTLQEEVAAAHGRVWVVHRLDRWTTGVLLFARTAAAHRAVNLAFDGREVSKRYLALVRGAFPQERTITTPIAPGRRGRMRVMPDGDPRGKPSETRVRSIEVLPERPPLPSLSLVEAAPSTGRTHQIRVHLAGAGAPLAFDPEYGSRAPLVDGAGRIWLDRTPLHAARLELRHPATGRPLAVDAPLPPDLEELIAYLRGG